MTPRLLAAAMLLLAVVAVVVLSRVVAADYRWHARAQVWQQEGPGEASVQELFGGDLQQRLAVASALGMTGRMLVEPTTRKAERPEYRLHEHWRMDFGDRLVRFVDPRRFGALDVVHEADATTHPLLASLGHEPLEKGFDGAFLFAKCRGRKVAIKLLLMNASVLVGVGNIYASEACWRARVRPRRAAKTLTRAHQAAAAGSTIWVMTGTYSWNTTVALSKSGTQAAPISRCGRSSAAPRSPCPAIGASRST